MDLSIIIVSHNTKHMLDDCIASVYASLQRAHIAFEILVIDNASADGTIAFISKKYPKIIILKNTTNTGFGSANNKGIKKSRGTYSFLLNSDTVITNRAIEKLLEFIQRHPKSFVGPKLLNIDRSIQTSCGPFFSLPVVAGSLFLKGDLWGLTRWSPRKVKQVDWVSGAAIMGYKEDFQEIGFNEKIFMYMDELDFLYRARKKGYKTFFYPYAHVIHEGSGSSPDNRKTPILNIYRGLLSFYQSYHSPFQLKLLKILLKCKAIFSIAIGTINGNSTLREIYEKAYRMV